MKIIIEKKIIPVSKELIEMIGYVFSDTIPYIQNAEIMNKNINIEENTVIYPISPLKDRKNAFTVTSKVDCNEICPLSDGNRLRFVFENDNEKSEIIIGIDDMNIDIISGNAGFDDVASSIPHEIPANILEKRKKIAAESYFSDEGFASEFMEAAEENEIDMGEAQKIYKKGEKYAKKIGIESIFLNEDDFLVFLNKRLILVQTKVMSLLNL